MEEERLSMSCSENFQTSFCAFFTVKKINLKKHSMLIVALRPL